MACQLSPPIQHLYQFSQPPFIGGSGRGGGGGGGVEEGGSGGEGRGEGEGGGGGGGRLQHYVMWGVKHRKCMEVLM